MRDKPEPVSNINTPYGRDGQRNIDRLSIRFKHPITNIEYKITPSNVSGNLCFSLPEEYQNDDCELYKTVPTNKQIIETRLSKMFGIQPEWPEFSHIKSMANYISGINTGWRANYEIQTEHQGGDHL